MYQKPTIVKNNDIAEGIFAASGVVTKTAKVDLAGLEGARHIMVTFSTDIRYVSHTIGGYQNGNNKPGVYQPELSFRSDEGNFVNGTITVEPKDPNAEVTVVKVTRIA